MKVVVKDVQTFFPSTLKNKSFGSDDDRFSKFLKINISQMIIEGL